MLPGDFVGCVPVWIAQLLLLASRRFWATLSALLLPVNRCGRSGPALLASEQGILVTWKYCSSPIHAPTNGLLCSVPTAE